MALSINERRVSKLSSSISTTSYRDKDVNSVYASFNNLLKNFPKEVKRRDLIELYSSLLFGRLDEAEEIEAGVNALLALLFNTITPLIDRLIVIDCLQIMAPQPDLCQAMESGDVSCLANSLPVVLAQGAGDLGFKKIVTRIIENIENPKINENLQPKILGFFGQLVSSKDSILSTEQMKFITNFAVQKLITTNRAVVAKELDGAVTQDMPTLLSIGETVTVEQILNSQSFLFLLPWLENICDISNTLDTSAPTDPFSNLRLRELLSPESLTTIKEYCLHIIEQSERNALIPSDIEVQKGALAEALNLLSLVCTADSDHVPSCLSIVRRLHDRNVTKQPSYLDVVVLVASSQFLMRHCGIMMRKVDDIVPFLFRDTVSLCYSDSSSSFEIIKFVRDNLANLCYNSSLLEKYFPSLLKIVAWSPSTFEGDFLHILPSFLSSLTSVEAFHSLLDLPCLTASLLLQQGNLKTVDLMRVIANPILMGLDPSLLQIFGRPEYQAMFNYILRPSSGMGDTFNRVEKFHSAIEPLAIHPRVVACSKTATRLLGRYFDVVIQNADAGLTSLLLPGMLERVTQIYPVKGYSHDIQKVISEAILKLIEKHPELIIHLHEELVDFVSEIKKVTTVTQVYTNLVWAIGEYTSISYTNLCKPEIVTRYYDGLETIIYEILSSSSDIESHQFPKLVCVVLTTLSELASRSQELLPRAILCLSKAGQKLAPVNSVSNEDTELQDIANKIVMDRINELLAILRMPNVASLLLSPPKEIYSGKWHKDPTALPVTLKTIVTLLGSESIN